jgi:hypothetical protein
MKEMLMTKKNVFFKFAAFHSFLIGLLPFYIPILLWQQGFELWQLSFFIALTGLGFLLVLPLWQNLYANNDWNTIIRTSFILETLLFTAVLFLDELPLIASLFLVALLNGAYLCFYWTSQRTLFTQLEHEQDDIISTGNNFGNFQIVVMVLLKVGILLSAFLLEQGFETLLFGLSLVVALIGVFSISVNGIADNIIENIVEKKVENNQVSLDKPTRTVFYLDGIFLYLESYFWLLSLYLIAQQDIMQLGFLVVGLTVLLAGLFWLIKGRIDAAPANTIFQLAIAGYAISWLLRGIISLDDSSLSSSLIATPEISYPLILLIAFLTSFFRLSFNKRFFDHAHLLNTNQTTMIQYLLDKSTLSQFGIFVFFSVLGIVLFALSMTSLLSSSISLTLINGQLSWVYMAAAPFVLLYGFYSQPLENTQGRPSCIR